MSMQSSKGTPQPVRAEKSSGFVLEQSANLGPNPYFPATPEPSREQQGEAGPQVETAPDGDAGSSAEQQIAGDGEETFLEGSEAVDTNSPEYKKLFASYTRQRQKDRSEIGELKERFERELRELRANFESKQAVPDADTVQGPVGQDGLRVDNYKLYQFKPDSSLSGLEEEIREATIHYILETVRDLREQGESQLKQHQQMTTRQKLEGFVSQIPAEKYKQAEALIREHSQMLSSAPESFIRLATYELGLNEPRPQAEESPNVVPPQRLADKRRAAVPRPSQSSSQTASKPFQAKTLEEAIGYALEVHGVR